MNATVKRVICAILLLVMIAYLAPITSVSAASAGERLQGTNETIYNFLKPLLFGVANGQMATAEFVMGDADGIFVWTKEELGVSSILSGNEVAEEAIQAADAKFAENVNFSKIVSCLLADCPYELYWFDKLKGASVMSEKSFTESDVKVTRIIFQFSVYNEYSTGGYTLDTNKTKAAASVTGAAQSIVDKHANKSDREKLQAYKDEICQLASYNQVAADNPEAHYGNPWQLTSVFDGDPATNPVCEGYAKAFKYLCDLSTFSTEVNCYLVEGNMKGGTGEGAHMWNVVEIDGGRFLVDVTNCDSGTIGEPDQLFLKVGQKDGEKYIFNCVADAVEYTYAQSQKDLHTNGYLELTEATEPENPEATLPEETPTQKPTVSPIIDNSTSAPSGGGNAILYMGLISFGIVFIAYVVVYAPRKKDS